MVTEKRTITKGTQLARTDISPSVSHRAPPTAPRTLIMHLHLLPVTARSSQEGALHRKPLPWALAFCLTPHQ